MKILPQKIKRFLWSSDKSQLDSEKHKMRIILNVLNLGDKNATAWLFKQYSESDIKAAIIQYGAKELSPKSLNYWLTIMDIDPSRLITTRF